MASTFYNSVSGYWVRKVRTVAGKYQTIKLGKPNPCDDPRLIPPHIHDLADRYSDFGAKPESPRQFTPAPTKPIDLETRLESFYRLQCEICRPLTLKKLRQVIDEFKSFCRSQDIVCLHEVRASTVQDYVDLRMARGGISARSLRTNLSLLGKLWSQAIRREEYHGPNPVRSVCHDLPTTDTTTAPDSLSDEEIDALMGEIARRKARPFPSGPSSHLPQWVEDIILVMLNTALRVNAAIHMEFKWVNGSKLTVPEAYAKMDRSYSTMVNPKVATILARRRQEVSGARVFPECRGSSWLYSRMRYLARALIRQGKWTRDPRRYNHILRHTFITESLKRGVPLVMVSKLAGHTSTRMTERYDHSKSDDAIKWALDKNVVL
jgi:integrase/recombinase XerD